MADLRFEDRVDAGRRLAALLRPLQEEDVVALGVPQGGVQVAAIVAVFLATPLDILVVQELVAPGQGGRPAAVVGALAEDAVVLDDPAVADMRLTDADIEQVRVHEVPVLAERVATLRRKRPRLPVSGATVLILADGFSTAVSLRAACVSARQRGATRVLVALPVGPADLAERLPEADEVFCLVAPEDYTATADYYDDFTPITDDLIVRLIAQSR